MTAKAIELLVTADAIAAEAYVPKQKTRRLWHEPLWWVSLLGMVALVLVATAMLLLLHRSDVGAQQRDRLQRVGDQQSQVLDQQGEVLRQIASCVDPSGACAQRGQQTTSKAVDALSRATRVIVECADDYSGDTAIDRCIAERLADRG